MVALTAAPASGAWTDTSGRTHHRICRRSTPSARDWILVSRVRDRAGSVDARAGVVLHHDGHPRQRWSSCWPADGERERGDVRIERSRTVRIHVWQEAGDRVSDIGTAVGTGVFRARDIERCG